MRWRSTSRAGARARPGAALRARGVEQRFTAYVIGRAYRGREIHRAMADYLYAVHHDDPLELEVDGLPAGIRSFDLSQRSRFGLRASSGGLVQEWYHVEPGKHMLLARLRDGSGNELGFDTFERTIEENELLKIKIEMRKERSRPHFILVSSTR